MVEQKLTQEDEVQEKYRKVGVVIFLFNGNGEILVVQEQGRRDSDGGQQGDFSVLCEAAKDREDWTDNVIRALSEELGVDQSAFKIDPKRCFLGESMFGEGVLARVVAVLYDRDPGEIFNAKGDGEVVIVGWRRPVELLELPLRPGVSKILRECLEQQTLDPIDPISELIELSNKALGQAVKRVL